MVIRAVLDNKEIPERKSISHSINDDLWNLWVQCWDKDPKKRPKVAEVLESMAKIKPAQQLIIMDESKPEEQVGNTFLPTPISGDVPVSKLSNNHSQPSSPIMEFYQSYIGKISDETLRDIFRRCNVDKQTGKGQRAAIQSVCRRWRRIVQK